jgi:PKD repeat protein
MLFISNLANATTRRVLFIGNSYIYTNDVPALLTAFATSMGDTLIYDQHVPGAYTFEQHSTNATTINKIYSQQWDVVILQEQSQRPSFPPAQVEAQVYPYAAILDSMIHDNNSCTQTMFLMTWGRKNGDDLNCGGYPIVCTYNGMQARLRESYMEMALLNTATVAPVGAAWKVTRDSFPSIELYSPDNSHPVIAGSYLETCVLYASIFHKKPNLSTYYSTVPQADAINLQNVATHVVFDSLNQWQQLGNYVFADFDIATSSQTITLTNNSAEATAYTWDFGDGNTSTATTPPAHTYAANGIYDVTLTSSNSCFTEVAKKKAYIGVSSVNGLQGANLIKIYSGEPGFVTISSLSGFEHITIYSVNGQKVVDKELNDVDQIREELTPGIYTINVFKKGSPATMKFSVL